MKAKRKTWPKGYLAKVLKKIKDNQKRRRLTFSQATWNVCYYQETNMSEFRARQLEKSILAHMKRVAEITVPEQVVLAQEVPKVPEVPNSPLTQLAEMIGYPVNKLVADAFHHEKAHCLPGL
jgi:hypothetical protein